MEEDYETLDILSSKQKGQITENRVVELITFGSKGRLTCYTPNSDDDGIDLIVNLKTDFKPLFLQVKSRFKLNKTQFVQNVKESTFKSNKSFYLIFILFSEEKLEVERVWLIPSEDFKQTAFLKGAGENYKSFYRFSANPLSKKDRWSMYLVDKTKLGEELLSVLNTL